MQSGTPSLMRSGPGQLGGDTSQQQPRKVREILDKAKCVELH